MRNLRRPWSKLLITSIDKEGKANQAELEFPAYKPSKLSTARNHRENNHGISNPINLNCFYCKDTNNDLTLKEQEAIIEQVNKLVEEKKGNKNGGQES